MIQVSTSAARGKGKDLLFCIRKAYWRPPPPDEVVEKAPLVDHDEWFENDKDSDAPVQVRGLRKVFGKKVAVSDATFAIATRRSSACWVTTARARRPPCP